VDTNANPPRAIWVHPYEDEHYLKEHPEVRGRKSGTFAPPSGPPPEKRPHSWDSTKAPASPGGRGGRSAPGSPGPSQQHHDEKRGFFGKLKDKAIGTKEEREQARQREMQVCTEGRIRLVCFGAHGSCSFVSSSSSSARPRSGR
jgi:hypothetical protein